MLKHLLVPGQHLALCQCTMFCHRKWQ